jgi:hypothetical protein
VTADDEIQVIRGKTITIRVTILQNGSYGEPVQNQSIHYFDQTYNTFLGSSNSNQNGIASLDWDIPLDHPLGLTVINATFYGNESLSLSPSSQRVTIIVLSCTHLEVNQIPMMLAPGDLLSFSVHLVDDSNISISNVPLTVSTDTLSLASEITNSTGYAVFEIECNSSWITLGENNINISYEGDPINFLDGTEFLFTVEINQISTYLNFDSSYQNMIELDTVFDIEMTLSDENNTLPDEVLEVTLDSSHLTYITTNSSGTASFNIRIDERFSLGIHSLRIHYNGTHRYSQSSLEAILEICSPITMSVQVSENAIIGVNLQIEAIVTDIFNRSISNFIISITDMTTDQSFSVPIESETSISFQYRLQGPPGIHNLVIEILDNPFIFPIQYALNFTVWSNSKLVLVNSGVDHYAYPSQEILFEVRLTDWHGNISSEVLQLFIDNIAYTSGTTTNEGHATFIFVAPTIEAQYNISIIYTGNLSRYELATKYDYNLFVTTMMPIVIELRSYELIAPLHEISVFLTVRGLNGSLLKGVRVNFNWLSSNIATDSQVEGLIVLHLTIPPVSDNYFLYYESEPSSFVESASGSILIEITIDDIISTEGVGITGMIIALGASIGLVAVPVLRRKYLIG